MYLYNADNLKLVDYLATYNKDNFDDNIKEIKQVPEFKITFEEIFMENVSYLFFR